MLLDDDAIAQQFAVLLRAAEALKQVTILSPSRSSVPPSPYPHLEAGHLPSPARASFAPHGASERAPPHAVGATKATPTPSPNTFSFRRERAASVDQMDLGCIEGPVQLPRTIGDGEVDLLRDIGCVIESVTALLQQSLDAKLVDFYTHLSKKADADVEAGVRTTTNAAATSNPYTNAPSPQPPKAASTRAYARTPAETHRAGPTSILHEKDPPRLSPAAAATATTATTAAATPSASWSPPAARAGVAEGGTAEALPSRQRTAFILDPHDDLPSPLASVVLSVAGENDSSILDHSHQDDAAGVSSRQSSMHLPKGLTSRTASGYAMLHNAPMARRMEEERAAAAELQSFFCLLLEAALRQTDSTAAAIYLDDATLHNTNNTGAGADASFLRTSSFVGGARNSAGPNAGASTTNAGGGAAANRAQFLHCVAHVHGHFPHTISCALTNVLTTVVQTGIAVNLNYSEASAVLRPNGLDGASSDRAGTHTARSAAAAATATRPSLYLSMYNGVVVPVKGVGCLVLANKAKRSSAVPGALPPRFSVCDEHVAWSSALISEAVLQLYDRELLVRAAGWAPPCAAILRPFLHAKEAPPPPPPATTDGFSRGRGTGAGLESKRMENRLGSRRRLPSSKSVQILPDPAAMLDNMQKDEAASLVFNAQNDIFTKRLTIVRTEDRQIGKALPPELRTSSPATISAPATQKIVSAVTRSGGGAAGSFVGTSGQLNDEEVFLAAAQYINNLESLWRKTITDSNTMHTMVDNYNKEIQIRGEKIVHLESRVRELNAHVVQLERRTNPARFYASTSLQY